MNNVLKDNEGNILNPKIPRYEGTMKEIKFVMCYKNAMPPTAAYTHQAGGYRIDFGAITTFTNYPSDLKEQLAVVPIGCYKTADPSCAGGVALYGTGVWGHGCSNETHTCMALVIYR